ncbi:hypothetical protein AC249_AIPGENE18224, partial [Exaiptasia diaphana]
NGGCSFSNQSFLYSLYNIKGFQPVKLNLTGKYNKHAIGGYAGYGPIFGCEYVYYHDNLHISNHASSNDYSYSYLGRAYQPPPGCTIPCPYFLVGKFKFTPSDVEVFYETTA